MNATKFLHTQLLRTPLTPLFHASLAFQTRHRRLSTVLYPIRSSSSGSGQGSKDGETMSSPSPVIPPDDVEIRFRRGSRKRQREQQNFSNEQPRKTTPAKSWEEMSMSEKAIELYMGEKGALFWLNKFAYASIFIIIGGWILFRFVGPALDLYQLDTPPLEPKAMFKG